MDVNLCYGITPMEHRERYREAFALTLKAWQAREIFAWNGRYFQLATVNLWPRPIQQPHPPVWVPGSGSISTFDFAVEHDVCYCFLSYSGARSAKTMMDAYWRVVAEKGRDLNPYRAGFLQLVVVAESDARAEEKFARHVEYFYHKCLHVPVMWFSPPGNQDYRSLVASMANPVRRAENPKNLRYRDFVDKGYVIAGSPATVRDRLKEEVIKGLRVGQLDGAPADRLDAARARAGEHRALRPRGAAGAAPRVGRRGLGESLVAGAPAAARPPVDGRGGRRRMSAAVGTSSASEVQERTITVWQDRVRIRVLSKGRGPSLVFFHGPWGLAWDPFLDELAQHFTVHAPEHPGTTPDAHDDVYHLDGLWDLVLCYDELLTALGIESAVMVGHSFGGMVACELAAAYPDRTRRQALIAPLGFWRDPDRIVNWMMLEPGELRRHIFRDPEWRRGAPNVSAPGRPRDRGDGGPRPADVGHGHDRQVHLAHSRQGAEEADPPRRRRPRCSSGAERTDWSRRSTPRSSPSACGTRGCRSWGTSATRRSSSSRRRWRAWCGSS